MSIKRVDVTPAAAEVIEKLKQGKKVARKSWNDKGMFAYYVPANIYKSNTDVAIKEFGEYVTYNPYFAIKNVNGSVSTWSPSVNDCLTEDWIVVE